MFEPDAHVGEDAELYALGELDAIARERVDRHVRACGECARRVGEAESAVLGLIEGDAGEIAPHALRPFRVAAGRPAWQWAAAVAAAFVLGLIPWLVSMRATAPPAQQLAMTAMLDGHFMHAPFAAANPGAPNAKAIYARNGAWIYVLAAPADGALDVVAVSNGKRSKLGTIAPGTATRGAFFTEIVPADKLELVRDGRTIASATLVYPASNRR